ncbi:hypothetical protein DPMN_148548 [Dreissena polymorpha]|uniref:Uncharacterized protein n=1 Tax=Dreissena polymorpha TaxID=45954 RepID=A0A9D4J437_DREPO|nr:hypothetical protein DPMN_148548 [Dreissena polymorpha]
MAWCCVSPFRPSCMENGMSSWFKFLKLIEPRAVQLRCFSLNNVFAEDSKGAEENRTEEARFAVRLLLYCSFNSSNSAMSSVT